MYVDLLILLGFPAAIFFVFAARSVISFFKHKKRDREIALQNFLKYNDDMIHPNSNYHERI